MIQFILGKTKVSLDFSFFAALCLYTLLDQTGYAILCFSACLLHESGHLLALNLAGQAPQSICFYGAGIKLKSSHKSFFVLISGCAVNFLLFILFIGCKNDLYAVMFAVSNLFVGIINLLPISTFDGSQILEALLYNCFDEKKAYIINKNIRIILTTLLIIIVFILIFLSYINFTIILMGVYMVILDFTQ